MILNLRNFIFFTLFFISSLPSYSASNLSEIDVKQSLGAQILQQAIQYKSMHTPAVNFADQALKDKTIFKLSDFNLRPFPASKDKRFADVASVLLDGERQLVLLRWDAYEFAQHVIEEVEIKKRPGHEVSNLFLRGEEVSGFCNDSARPELLNLFQYLGTHELFCKVVSEEKVVIESIVSQLIENISAYMDKRAYDITHLKMKYLTCSDVRHTYLPFNQFAAELANECFETNMLMIRGLFEKAQYISPLAQNFLQKFPMLHDFFQGKNKDLLDVDSYIEMIDRRVAATHAARRGDGFKAVLEKVSPPVVVAYVESEVKSRQEKRRQNRYKNKKSKKYEKEIPVKYDPNLEKYARMLIEFMNDLKGIAQNKKELDRKLKREEIDREKEKKLLQIKEADMKAFSSALEVSLAPLPKADPQSFPNFAMLNWDDPLPALKTKVKTRKNTQQQEVDQKGLTQAAPIASEASDVHPMFECDPYTLEIHRELMGPYTAKLNWKKIERLAKAFGMDVTIPGHGGSHRGLKYTDATGQVRAFSVPVRSVYGKRFFNLLQEYFRDICHLDDGHVVLAVGDAK